MFETVIEIDELTVEEAKESYPRLFHTYQQRFSMSDEQAALAVSIAVGTCPDCWESPVGCQCWNDE